MGRKDKTTTTAACAPVTQKKGRPSRKEKNDPMKPTETATNVKNVASSSVDDDGSVTKLTKNAGDGGGQASAIKIQSDINQRPRRQIKHKYIKTIRNQLDETSLSAEKPLSNNSTVAGSTDNPLVNDDKSTKQTKSTKESHAAMLHENEQFIVGDHSSIQTTNLSLQRKQRRKVCNDDGNKDANAWSETYNATAKTDEENVMQIVEIIDDAIQEEIVETSTLNETAGTNQYEYYLVEDSSQDEEKLSIKETTAPPPNNDTENKHTYLVTIEETSSNSEISQNFGKQIYVEVTESLDSQEMVEVVTTYDSNSQENSIESNVAAKSSDVHLSDSRINPSSNIRNSFEGALSELKCQASSGVESSLNVQKRPDEDVKKESNVKEPLSAKIMPIAEAKSAEKLPKNIRPFIPTRRMTRLSSMALNASDDMIQPVTKTINNQIAIESIKSVKRKTKHTQKDGGFDSSSNSSDIQIDFTKSIVHETAIPNLNENPIPSSSGIVSMTNEVKECSTITVNPIDNSLAEVVSTINHLENCNLSIDVNLTTDNQMTKNIVQKPVTNCRSQSLENLKISATFDSPTEPHNKSTNLDNSANVKQPKKRSKSSENVKTTAKGKKTTAEPLKNVKTTKKGKQQIDLAAPTDLAVDVNKTLKVRGRRKTVSSILTPKPIIKNNKRKLKTESADHLSDTDDCPLKKKKIELMRSLMLMESLATLTATPLPSTTIKKTKEKLKTKKNCQFAEDTAIESRHLNKEKCDDDTTNPALIADRKHQLDQVDKTNIKKGDKCSLIQNDVSDIGVTTGKETLPINVRSEPVQEATTINKELIDKSNQNLMENESGSCPFNPNSISTLSTLNESLSNSVDATKYSDFNPAIKSDNPIDDIKVKKSKKQLENLKTNEAKTENVKGRKKTEKANKANTKKSIQKPEIVKIVDDTVDKAKKKPRKPREPKKTNDKVEVTSLNDNVDKSNLTAEQTLALDLLRQLEQSGKQKKTVGMKPANKSLIVDGTTGMPRVRTAAEKKEMKPPKEKPKKKTTNDDAENDSTAIKDDTDKSSIKSKKMSTKHLENDQKMTNRKEINDCTSLHSSIDHLPDEKIKPLSGKKNRSLNETTVKCENTVSGSVDNKQSSGTANSYSILSECYLPKMVKYDESLYSIEALKAAQLAAEQTEEQEPVIPTKTYATRPQKCSLPKKTTDDTDKDIIDENYFLTEYNISAEQNKQQPCSNAEAKSNQSNIEPEPQNVEKQKKTTSNNREKDAKQNDGTSPSEEETNIRRSGRIKTKTESNQRSHGYGLVKDKERFMFNNDCGYGSMMNLSQDNQFIMSDNSNSSIMDIREEFMQYFEPRVKSADELEKEIKDVDEGLHLFTQIVENEYKCERIISKEGRKMTCDCFLTKSEIERGELGCGEDCLNRLLMIECGNRCVVGERCTNKRFQKIQNAECSIVKTEKKGFGLKAVSMIPAGEFIMEYVGEVLNSKQFEEKAEEYCKDNNKHFYFMALRSDCVIDATSRGNISRFINHSCDPNAETQKWTVNGELRVGFFSKRNIYPDQEITFDYQFQRYGKEAQKCYCEAECCRGWIGEEPDSEEEFEEVAEEEDNEELAEEDTKVLKTEIKEDTVKAVIDEVVHKDLKEPIVESLTEPTDIETEVLSPSPIKVTKVVQKDKRIKEKNLKKLKVKRPDITDDLDLEQEINYLIKSNLKNQAHTLQFSRLMVRAKQQKAKSQLLNILRNGELACRRLFLDYHGLKLLYTWMCDSVSSDMKIEWEFRIDIMETLEVLPIPNKTMLQDSKVMATITKWSTASSLKENSKSPDESPSDSGSATPITEDNTSPKADESQMKEIGEQQVLGGPSIKMEIECKKESNDVDTQSNRPAMNPAISREILESVENSELMRRVKTLALKLLAAWESLTEVFRIPKKLRIEQMKEHEREADLSYEAMGGTQDIDRKSKSYKGNKEREYDKEKHWEKDRTKHKESNDYESSLTKQQRRQLFEAKVAQEIEMEKQRSEEEIEHAAKCAFFRLDPRTTSRSMAPFCVDPTIGQWYSAYNQMVTTPPSHAHIKPPPKKQSTNPSDYDLPPMDLPDFWKYAIDDQGRLYYYHVKIRIPQWEPPIKILPLIEEQTTKEENSSTDANVDDKQDTGIHETDLEPDDDDDKSSVLSHDSSEDELENRLMQLKKTITENRIALDSNLAEEISALATTSEGQSNEQSWTDTAADPCNPAFNFDFSIDSVMSSKKRKRRDGLVQERIISPRTDEERIQLKQELKRYKENKEKLRRRREEAKRRKSLQVLGPLSKKVSKITEGLPVLSQDDDIDSDEEESISTVIVNERQPIDEAPITTTIELETDRPVPFISLNKIVDELDALKRNPKPTKRIKIDCHREPKSIPKSAKRKKIESGHGHVNSEAAKRIKDKFRTEIAGVIVHHLSPYRKETCKIGRITTNDDFKHLAKKLTHFVMLKELKHCDNTVNVLEVTDSVKQKSKEFIRKYMAKFGEVYAKPDNEPEYRDFNQ